MEFEFATLVVCVGGVIFLLFLSLCLATGLYYLAEVIEEYTVLAKRVLTAAARATLAVHAALLLWDRLPLLPLSASAVAQLAYLRLLRDFPFISAASPLAWLSIGLLLAAQGLWMRHFWHGWRSLEYILAFLLALVWAVPFTLFISLAATDAVLPGSAGGAPLGAPHRAGGNRKRGLLLSVYAYLRRTREDALPAVSALTAQLAPAKPHVI